MTGGGLVRAILADKSGPFKVRAITRDVNSDKAKTLAAQARAGACAGSMTLWGVQGEIA